MVKMDKTNSDNQTDDNNYHNYGDNGQRQPKW